MREWNRLAAFLTVFSGKPRVKVILAKVPICEDKEIPCESKFRVTAVNTGSSPIEISEIGIRWPDSLNFCKSAPLSETLSPADEISVYFNADDLKDLKRYDVVYAKERTGRSHYPQVTFFAGIARWWWWRFGKVI